MNESVVNIDRDGNKFIINQKKDCDEIKISLINGKTVSVGNIANNIMSVWRGTNHIFRKGNMIGFSEQVIKNSIFKYNTIKLNLLGIFYIIPRNYILENGKLLNFKNKGFELQLFIGIDDLKEFKL